MDDMKLEKVTLQNMRGQRYAEIFVIKETGLEVYNTAGLNDCPDELWNGIDPEKIKQEFGAVGVQKSGPRYWMMDRQVLLLGDTASFAGLEARWAARAPLSVVQAGAAGGEPFKIYTPAKTQSMVYESGKPVFELIDPDGHVYVLQARESQIPLESLPTLGEKMKLMPEGWQYRTRTLTEDLELDLGPHATIYAVGDDFKQYYTRI